MILCCTQVNNNASRIPPFFLHTFQRCIIISVLAARLPTLQKIYFTFTAQNRIQFNTILYYTGYSNFDCKSFVENWRNSLSLRFQERVIIIIVIIYSQTLSSALFTRVEMMTKENRSSCKQIHIHTHTLA